MSSQNTQPTEAAIDAALAVEELPPFNQLALALANGVMAAYNAYQNNTTPFLPGYTYVASIWVQESSPETKSAGGPASPTPATPTPGPEAGLPPWTGNTLLGFAAYANDGSHNIIVLRGTVTPEEAVYDLYGWGTNTACMLPSNSPTKQFGNVKQDLYDFYTPRTRVSLSRLLHPSIVLSSKLRGSTPANRGSSPPTASGARSPRWVRWMRT